MALESSIVKNILAYLNKLDGCIAEKVHGNAYQFGRPDINGCYRGRSFRIEVKSAEHRNKPSKAQEINMKKWRRAGSLCFVAYSVEDVKSVFEEEFKWQKQ